MNLNTLKEKERNSIKYFIKIEIGNHFLMNFFKKEKKMVATEFRQIY